MPLIFQKQITNATLLVWEIQETIDHFENLLPLTIAHDKEYRQRTTNKRKLEFLVPRLLIKTILNEEKTVNYTSQGQPYLDHHSVSISHSGRFASIIIGQAKQTVAIDIEQPTERVMRVLPKFLNPNEQPQTIDNPIRYYTLCWSAKETLFKYLPRPAIDFREHLHLSPFSLAESGIIEATQTHTPQETQKLQIIYFNFPDWVLTALISS